MGKGDDGAIMEYFEKMRTKDLSFFFSSVQLDEDDMITNIFWADTRSINDYSLFGDVICFDTTYRTNEYGRPFAPFVGVNHHKQTIIFGATLLYDETIESFQWLFKTFLGVMSRKEPKAILTDQSAAMASAIETFFKETTHRLCVWHIYQNAAKNLSHVFNGSKTFVHDFSNVMYNYEDEVEWLAAWEKMCEDYNLQENGCLKSQFKLKEKWAIVYGRNTFTADMKSTQRSENQRHLELLADFKMMHTSPINVVVAEMLCHGAEVYTPEVFKLFQDEYMKILNYNVYKIGKCVSNSIYKVCYQGTTKEHEVRFEPLTETVTCSRKKFTFVGILCAHALKVLDKKNVKRIPALYIMKRWSRHAKTRSIINREGVGIHDNLVETVGKRYSHLCRNFREVATCASEHEKLYTYANGCLAELLENLEKLMETLGLNKSSEDSNVHGETYANIIEQIDLVTPVGVKRKATIGRPRGRFKDPLKKECLKRN